MTDYELTSIRNQLERLETSVHSKLERLDDKLNAQDNKFYRESTSKFIWLVILSAILFLCCTAHMGLKKDIESLNANHKSEIVKTNSPLKKS